MFATPSANGIAALAIKARAGQTLEPFSVYDSADNTMVAVSDGVDSSGIQIYDWFGDTCIFANARVAASLIVLLKAHAAQSSDMLALRSSANATLSRFDKGGYFMTRKVAAPADADLVASEMALWLDATDGAAKLMVKAKSANGTVVTGSLALA